VRQPTAVAFAPARELQRQILLGGLSLGTIFAGLGWLMVDRITRPLLAIAAVADRLRRGESNVTIRVLPGEGEVARLSWSLNKLLNALYSQEQTLLATNDRLQQELLSRQRVEASLLKSEELSELKSRFFSLAAHEFRTPLTTILSSTELLEQYNHKLTPERKQQHFWRIKTSTKSMVQLLDEVLLVGKAEAGKLTFNPVPVNLSQLCASLVEEMQFSQGRQHAIDYVVGGIEASACLDEKLLRHALLNLLSNAIKYSPEGSPVGFELNFEGSQVRFVIRDEGIGIPPADRQRLFQSFQRASNVGTIPGTGLGLVVVKQAIDLHHGRIELDSAVGVGTTFTITLPLVPQEQAIESLSQN
jgi:signal transduction histidine kinase